MKQTCAALALLALSICGNVAFAGDCVKAFPGKRVETVIVPPGSMKCTNNNLAAARVIAAAPDRDGETPEVFVRNKQCEEVKEGAIVRTLAPDISVFSPDPEDGPRRIYTGCWIPGGDPEKRDVYIVFFPGYDPDQ